jgi:hypothetical protein
MMAVLLVLPLMEVALAVGAAINGMALLLLL